MARERLRAESWVPPPNLCNHMENNDKMVSEMPVPSRGLHSGLQVWAEELPGEEQSFCMSTSSAGVNPRLTNTLEIWPTLCTLRAGNVSSIPGEERSEGRGRGWETSGHIPPWNSLTHPCYLPALPVGHIV